MLLLIDNYDSFTYNLYQYIGEVDADIIVKRNDEISIKEIKNIMPSHIIISPGPGHPQNSGVTVEVVNKFSGKVPILGICLGHQAIGLAMGGSIGQAQEIVHGKQSEVYHDQKGILKGIPTPFLAVRYHSLAVLRQGFPECLVINAHSSDGTIMALSHKEYPVYGVQFHPESILSEYGKMLLKNFLEI